MQNSRYSYAHGGLISLKEARDLLHRHAPEGEHLAYINPREAALLRENGGSGVMTESGIRSYGLLKKITKPFAKVLDKIVPNEIKPALPFLAAAAPFLIGPMGLNLGLGTAASTAVGAGANIFSQLSQEGADKYGINPISLGLAALSGGLSSAQTPGLLSSLKAVPSFSLDFAANPELANLSQAALTSSDAANLVAQYGPEAANLQSQFGTGAISSSGTPLTVLEKAQNLGLSGLEKASNLFQPKQGQELFSLDTAKQALPGQATAVGDLAYIKAQRALDEYDQQQAALGAMGVANTESRKAAIRNAMQLSGYTNDEIENTILKFKFATGGRVGYEAGSNNQGVKTIPINLDAIAKQLFGDKLDNLTYTQKETVYNRYYDLKDKKAKGGLMSLGGNEMDFRAAGGFVPIGKKERADDVPARLSKNEFVFTAKAVRNAGGGDIKQGAKKMYQLMKNLEARA